MAAEKVFICDKCKKELTEKTVVKKSLGKNFEIHTVGTAIWKEKGEQYAPFCPHCDTPHFFGFDLKP